MKRGKKEEDVKRVREREPLIFFEEIELKGNSC